MVGDFNAGISSEEKQRGGSFTHYIAQSKNFNDFIFFNCFSIWAFLGSSFTWSNVQGGVLGDGHSWIDFLPNSTG